MIGLPAHAAIGGPGRVARSRPPRRHRAAQGRRSRRISPGRRRCSSTSTASATRTAPTAAFLCRGVAVRGAGRKPGPDRRIADRHDRAGDRAGAPAQRRLRRSADRAAATARVFVEGLGRRLDECRQRRHGRRLRGALSRSRSLQDRQRQPRPPGRRRAADRGVAPARDLPAPGRRARAAGRRRVRDPPQRAQRRRPGQRHRRPHPGGAQRAVLDRRPRSVHVGEHRHRVRPAHYANPDEIMRDADTAMYHAKSRGKARHEVFDADMHARVRDRLEPRERPAPRRRQQRLRGALPADRVAGLGHVRRLRVARPLEAQRRAGVAGDVRADRRGARADRAARHVGAPGGVPHVRRLAAAVPRRRPRLHHRQRLEPAAGAAELPARRASRRCARPG